MDMRERGFDGDSEREDLRREELAKQQLIRDVAKYRSNRVSMMTDLRKKRTVMDQLIHHGAITLEQQQVARLACCILAADLCIEDSAMQDKTGQMTELLRSPDVIDDLLGPEWS